jgi:hypothetical protein
MATVIYTKENPRRSSRIANKPKVRYYNEHYQFEQLEQQQQLQQQEQIIQPIQHICSPDITTNSQDTYKHTYQDEVTQTIHNICIKNGWQYSDDLVTDFYEWLPAASTSYLLPKFDPRTGKDIRSGTIAIAKDWTLHKSDKLVNQKYRLSWKKIIDNYCKKNKIIYNPLMLDSFVEWHKSNGYQYYCTPTFTINYWFTTINTSFAL